MYGCFWFQHNIDWQTVSYQFGVLILTLLPFIAGSCWGQNSTRNSTRVKLDYHGNHCSCIWVQMTKCGVIEETLQYWLWLYKLARFYGASDDVTKRWPSRLLGTSTPYTSQIHQKWYNSCPRAGSFEKGSRRRMEDKEKVPKKLCWVKQVTTLLLLTMVPTVIVVVLVTKDPINVDPKEGDLSRGQWYYLKVKKSRKRNPKLE